MAILHRKALARDLRALCEGGSPASLGDAELLERFAEARGDRAELAFAALVGRHGPMVLRACRSILRDGHDAEDAFQATFLLLARRARTLWVRDSLAPWLHSVACRVAAGTRAARARRQALERRAAGLLPSTTLDPCRDDLGAALHEEIERLPERLKGAVVLCYLQGLTHDEAAAHLGCPVGTVRSRLSRGRDRLRARLGGLGLAPTTPTRLAVPAVPLALATTTAHAAAQLIAAPSSVGLIAHGVLSLAQGASIAMPHPLKAAAVMLFATGAVAVGVSGGAGQDPKDTPTAPSALGPIDRPDPAPPQPPEPPAASPDASLLQENRALAERNAQLDQRLKDLERKLDTLAGGAKPGALPTGVDPDTVVKVRSRFNDALVEKVFVHGGSTVKKGDPLIEIKCGELAQAKLDCQIKYVQWDHDHKYLVAREPLAKEGRITQVIWTDTQNEEKKSRLDYLVARDRLATYGMTSEQIDKLLEGLTDDVEKAREAVNDAQDRSRMTIVSPIDGVVFARDVVAGNFYDKKDVLLILMPSATPAR